MALYECAFCGTTIKNAYICSECKRSVQLDSDWAAALVTAERDIRKLEKRDERFGMMCLSDYKLVTKEGVYDGWDVLDASISGIGGGVFDIMSPTEAEEESNWRDSEQFDVLEYCVTKAGLTPGEEEVAFMLLLSEGPSSFVELSSEEAAAMLSRYGGKTISAAAYRRRLSDLRRKIRTTFNLQLRKR